VKIEALYEARSCSCGHVDAALGKLHWRGDAEVEGSSHAIVPEGEYFVQRTPLESQFTGFVLSFGTRGTMPHPLGVYSTQKAAKRAARLHYTSMTQKPGAAPQAMAPAERDAEEGRCRPYMKIEKDAARFQACQKIAERLGPISDPKRAYEILREAAGHEVAERFGVMTLDTHLHLRGLWETGAGETDSVQAPKVPTLHAAIVDEAAAGIIYHVHPAASDYPSDADVEVTKGFSKAFDEVGILLMDHIIVAVGSRRGFYSFLQSKPEALR